jgi:hypothetical protein
MQSRHRIYGHVNFACLQNLTREPNSAQPMGPAHGPSPWAQPMGLAHGTNPWARPLGPVEMDLAPLQ